MADAAGSEDPRTTLAGPDPRRAAGRGLGHELSLRGQIDELAAAVGDQLARAETPRRHAALGRGRGSRARQAQVRAAPAAATPVDDPAGGPGSGSRARCGQPVAAAAALVWTLTSPEVHHMLVDGWQSPHARGTPPGCRNNLEAALLAADVAPDDLPASR